RRVELCGREIPEGDTLCHANRLPGNRPYRRPFEAGGGMTLGEVNSAREAVLRVELRGPSGSIVEVEAVIDTGFTEFLTLPPALVSDLGLPFKEFVPMILADDSVVHLAAHDAFVMWHGAERQILVYATPGGPLLGMTLLYGSRVTLDVIDGGPVSIQELA